jgi:lanosterol synthase
MFRRYCLIFSSSSPPSRTIKAAIKYLHDVQTPEGGWIGSWGICMTYATQFALESLSLVGETYDTSASVRRACEFLLSHQREDGGFGESYKVPVLASLVLSAVTDSTLRWDTVVRAE